MARKEKQKLLEESDNIVFPPAVYDKAEPDNDYSPDGIALFSKKFVGRPIWHKKYHYWNVAYSEQGKIKNKTFLPGHYMGQTNEQQMLAAYQAAVDFRKSKEESGEIGTQKKAQLDKK